ncbi:hypothetical protein BPOR_0334g00020 [Botrytis porri]|uniref:Uncharacterized protein n=1 Tax=Botrytis porri TaxID=87229 RepID=A0A4Z1KKK8_9HELO|nr:hypothetical protein BPOR_0334g00020 [Botrytis porri]
MAPLKAPTDPIALVGMSCRLPGGASDTSKLWDLLVNGRSGLSEIPKSRFNIDAFYHPESNKTGTINAKGGYFLEHDVRLFDNAFFGINNLEAKYMDPQQRQLLEVVYECFESAGITLEDVSGANIGCYVANFTTDFVNVQAKDPDLYHRYSATGFGPTILANRISHAFNLKGPSLVLDTACSSSLYALHVACAALNVGECDSAIVAGANLVQSPEAYIAMTKAGVLSSTSVSHTFDSSADGYGRGEGIAALYLKRLDHLNASDPVRSIIRGTAVNSNGYTPGITMPGVDGQEAVIRKAYAMAGLPLHDTTYIESHGTGTSIGDPIEVEAISRCFSSKSGHQPLLIGSVKPNLGHGEAVSGITSIIKATLALERQTIPPTIGVRSLNPQLKLKERNIRVAMTSESWPATATERISVNSFGYGGANAHAIIDSARMHVPPHNQRNHKDVEDIHATMILPFSAHNTDSLTRNATAIASSRVLSKDLQKLAYTLASHRSSLQVRGYVLAHKEGIESNISTTPLKFQPSSVSSSPIAFVLTGQGAQSARMGANLLDRFPVFTQTIDYLDVYLKSLDQAPIWSLREIILESEEYSTINQASRSQPICTALQIGLVTLLKDWNIEPTAVIGHSSGEICAAYAAGFITMEEAMAIAYYRGLVVSKMSTRGAMMVVGLDHERVVKHIAMNHLYESLRVACINSPESTTVSGDADAIDILLSALEVRKIFVRKLKTDGKAYHSHLMQEIGQFYEDLLLPILSRRDKSKLDELRPDVKMFSSVVSDLVQENVVRTPAYWRKNLESPVLFSGAMKSLLSSGSYHMIEVGPHPALAQPVRDVQLRANTMQSTYFSTLSRGAHDQISMLNLVGSLYLQGHNLPFSKINAIQNGLQVIQDLPTYSWAHKNILWNESRISSEYRTQKYKRHDLLGSKVPGTPGRAFWWRNTLKLQEVPWIQDHKLGQTIVFPAAAYLAMAIEGLLQAHDHLIESKVTLKQVHLLNLLVLEAEGDGVELTMQLEPARLSSATTSEIWWRFEICSRVANVVTVHANGLIATHGPDNLYIESSFSSADSIMEEQSTKTWYKKLAKEGLCFGPEFHSLVEIKTDRSKRYPGVLAQTKYRRGSDLGAYIESDYVIHPVTIDAMLQAAIVGSAAGVVHDFRGKIPVMVSEFNVFISKIPNAAEICNIKTSCRKVGIESVLLSGELQSPDGKLLARMEDIRAIPYKEHKLRDPTERNPYLQILWKPNVSTLTSENSHVFASYLEQFSSFLPSQFQGSDMAYLTGAVDLITHSNGRAKILELSDGNNDQLEQSMIAAGIGGKHQRFDSYMSAVITPDGSITCDAKNLKPEHLFDVIVVSSKSSTAYVLDHFDALKPYFAPNTFFVFTTRLNHSKTTITIARPESRLFDGKVAPDGSKFILVFPNATLPYSPLNHAIINELSRFLKTPIQLLGLEEVSHDTLPPNSMVVCTLELESPLLNNMTSNQLEHLKIISENAAFILWLTGGSLYTASDPNYAIVLGLSRSLMLERPSLQMPVYDIDLATPPIISAQNVVSVIKEVLGSETVPDTEYRQHEGVIYHSRVIPDASLNISFRRAQDEEVTLIPLQEAGFCRLAMKNVRNINTLRFQQLEEEELLPRGYVQVQVRAMGINARDYDALTEKVDVQNGTCSLEFSGIITATNSQVTTFLPGDRVVVLAPNHGGTHEQVPEWACCRLKDDEDFTNMATVPVAFSTALFALEERAKLETGQSILIHSATDSVGLAAIQIARLKGAEIYATVDTDAKKAFLVNKLHLPSSQVFFQSPSNTMLTDILCATSGKGVDVVMNCLAGDLLQASWKAVADFGTFIELEKRDIADGGLLDMCMFNSGVTFTVLDLNDIFWSEKETRRQTIHKLLHRSIELLREERIRPVSPLTVFPASQIVEAFRYFSSNDRIGKVALTLSPFAVIPVVPLKYHTRFDAQKAYILVGCLGGLGRSLSQWMLKRGAKNFIFIGRSGTSKAAARNTVADLRAAGADVEVVQGDVVNYADVVRGVLAAKQPIGGVVQAAMSIHVALFNETTTENWHSGISQKVQGTMNLYRALSSTRNTTQLDFFLMLSSVTGSVGVATESNYCAAGAFQDAFGAHLRSIGLPGISLGLGMVSEVGFLHERPDTEAVLLRKGLHPLTEDEFLQVVDGALNSLKTTDESEDTAWGKKHHMGGHILTGLELQGFQKHRDMGFVRGVVVLEDPRLTYMARAFAASAPANSSADTVDAGGFPEAVAAALAMNDNDALPSAGLTDAIANVVISRISTLLLVPATQLQATTLLSDFGMESMLAAEFRSDMFRAFRVDVPFAILMTQGTQIQSIAELVGQSLLEQR